MVDANTTHDEITILYSASQKLTQAATPIEQLEAVSDYPRSMGAAAGVLIYFHEATGDDEVVAEWKTNTVSPMGLGTRLQTAQLPFTRTYFASPDRPTLVHDLLTDPRVDAQSREGMQQFQTRAAAILPLQSKGRRIGAIIFRWSAPYIFDDHDQRIYTALQQQAAPVVDSIRLVEQAQSRAAELEEARHELTTLFEASRALVRAWEPAELLEAVSGYARENGATAGTLFYSSEFADDMANDEPALLEVVATWATDPEYVAPIGAKIDFSVATSAQDWIRRPEKATLYNDVFSSEDLDPESHAAFVRYHAAALAQLPLYMSGKWIGTICFAWDTPQTFTERDHRIYTALQQQVAPVIDSIRLSRQSRQRTLELEAAYQEINLLYHISEVINGANSYDEIVEAVAQVDLDADVVALMLWENLDWQTATYLEVVVVLDRVGNNKIRPGARLPKDDFPIAQTMIGERVWLFEDAKTDPRVDPITAQNWEYLDIRSFMGPALYINKRYIGGITFHSSKPRTFGPREGRMLTGVGDLVVAAIERIRSRNESEAARRRAEQLAEQAQKLAALEERTRLARELHDSISQVLYGIGISAQTAQSLQQMNPARLSDTLDYIVSLAEAGLTEMRALIFELRPESLEEEGLVTALRKQAASLQGRHGIQVDIEFCEEPRLPIDVKEGIYRIAREALHNTMKHAQATQVSLAFSSEVGGYRLDLADNGLGFDPDESFPGHLGLKSMRERAISLNGAMQIDSAPGRGTRISVLVPYG